jgi:2-polyprenyl-3-methyl-5-hydroxy-6-metoxy-1,4-benzoquinol methylase
MDVSRTRIAARARRLSPRQTLSAGWERALWGRRTVRWEDESSQGLTGVVRAVLDRCDTRPETVAIDLGCGSGQVTLPLAPRCARVLAVDVNGPAVKMLGEKAAAAGLTNIQLLTTPIQGLELDPGSIDLIVTNYTLHHLGDADKRALLADAIGWLKPGGQLVIGDMMFGRGSSQDDRAIITAKLRAMVVRGPAGWWRILKNVIRFTLRIQEKTLPVTVWERIVGEAGFTHLHTERIVQEACVLSAIRPYVVPAPIGLRAPRSAPRAVTPAVS